MLPVQKLLAETWLDRKGESWRSWEQRFEDKNPEYKFPSSKQGMHECLWPSWEKFIATMELINLCRNSRMVNYLTVQGRVAINRSWQKAIISEESKYNEEPT
jgi:hypothetical protein